MSGVKFKPGMMQQGNKALWKHILRRDQDLNTQECLLEVIH